MYEDRLLPDYKETKEVSHSPNGDVLSFRRALTRASVVSKVARTHISLLFTLSNYSDIIAHNYLSSIDTEKAKKLLLRDFFSLMSDYSEELALPLNKLIGDVEKKIQKIAYDNQESIEDKVKLKLAIHLKQWEEREKDEELVKEMKRRTDFVFKLKGVRSDSYVEKVTCPACDNESLVTIKTDFDYSDGSAVSTGVFVSGLKCYFCQLRIYEYEEIDYLGLDDLLTADNGLFS